MEDKKEWLFLFMRKFRETLDPEEYREYREFFTAFCKTPYLSIKLYELFDKQGKHTRNLVYLYSSDYGDQVEILEKKLLFLTHLKFF